MWAEDRLERAKRSLGRENSCAHNNRFLSTKIMNEDKKALAEKNIALAHFVAQRYKNVGVEYEEIVSCAYVGLVKAAIHFNPQKGYKFSSFAVKVMRNEILMFMRRENKTLTLSLETPIIPDGRLTLKDTIVDERNVLENTELMFDMEVNRAVLNEQENRLLNAKLRNPGMTQNELSEYLGVSQSYISRMLRMIKKKMMN